MKTFPIYRCKLSKHHSSGASSKESTDLIAQSPASRYPSTAAAVVPIYRVDGIGDEELVLSREAISAIYNGTVTMWNDNLIAATNPAISMPATQITVVVREDSSGTTEIFTKALSSFSADFAATIGFSKTPNWPKTFQGADGTDGVIAAVLANDGSIGYAILADAIDSGTDYASMLNRAGGKVSPSPQSVQSALSELAGLLLDNERLTADIHDASSSSAWPIAGLTYFILRKSYVASDCATRTATIDFLEWYYNSPAAGRVRERMGFLPFRSECVKE